MSAFTVNGWPSMTSGARYSGVPLVTPLAAAVNEMNRYSPTKLVVSSAQSGGIAVSGIFRAGDSVRFARAVADTYQLEVIEEPDRILLAGVPRSKLPIPAEALPEGR